MPNFDAIAEGQALQRKGLYTPDQRRRRDLSVWTTVQAVLAPLQFLVFLVSLILVIRFLLTGAGESAAMISIIAKTGLLYAIMVTGSIWEKDVFGQYLFVDVFFWEDVVSMLVLALHTAYLIAIIAGWGTPAQQMWLALAAYASYVVNAAQFLWKLRKARLEGGSPSDDGAIAPPATTTGDPTTSTTSHSVLSGATASMTGAGA